MPELIRPARDGDLPGLMHLYRSLASHQPEYDAMVAAPQWAAIQAMPGLTVLVAEADGILVSTCTLMVVPNMTARSRPWAVIENVATHEDHRCRGLGRRVLAHAVDLAWAAGCYKVSLATGSKREATLRFYEGAGFTRASKTYFEMRRT